jgi:hypothetical protein
MIVSRLWDRFVSGVFSAGIFSVQGAQSSSCGGQIVSELWPLFLLLCIGLTVLMFGLWVAWERYGKCRLRNHGSMNVRGCWQAGQVVDYTPYENERGKTWLSKSQRGLARLERDKRQRSHCSDAYYCLEHSRENTFRHNLLASRRF